MMLPIKYFIPMMVAGAGGLMVASHTYPFPVQSSFLIKEETREEAKLSDLEFWKK